MNEEFKIMVNDDELNKVIDYLRNLRFNIRSITRSYIVNEFGDIVKEVKIIHCQSTDCQYKIFKESNDLFGFLL